MAKTTEQQIKIKGQGQLWSFPVASGETIYSGTLAAVGADGLLYDMDAAAAKAARMIVLVADETSAAAPAATTGAGSISGSMEIKSSDAGDKTVRLCYIQGFVQLTFTAIAQTDVGKTVFATDNYTCDESQALGRKIGTLVTYISSTSGWVELNTFYQADGTIYFKGSLTKATVTTASAVLSWVNPTGETIMVEKLIVDLTGASTTAGTTLDFGTGTSTAARDNLIDGVNAATLGARVLTSMIDNGTNGRGAAKMTSTQYLTGTTSAALTASFAGTYAVYYRYWE